MGAGVEEVQFRPIKVLHDDKVLEFAWPFLFADDCSQRVLLPSLCAALAHCLSVDNLFAEYVLTLLFYLDLLLFL